MKKNYGILLSLFFISFTLLGQKPTQPDAADILLKLKKLNFLGTVLYVAAHPDDENTRLIAYMANERLANTAYLSMTRGDGGQNLIGPEIREALGVIRTQELLAARAIDGGQQFFTRTNDFGYSKSPEETQEIWDREKALGDVVWIFRKFRPDVIITRFPTDGGGGHGHHTTSAIFAHEAFDLAADKDQYTDQLEYVSTWQPKRLYLNTGRWWNPNISADEEGVLTVDVGQYNALLGESYTEMASRSRSQHKSQGFGSTGSRGKQIEYLEYRKGDKAQEDIFEGVETSWKRVKGGEKIGRMIEEIIANYSASNPAMIVKPLLEVRKEIAKIKDNHWREVKTQEVDELIKAATGLYLETRADDFSAAPGSEIMLNTELVNRSNVEVTLKSISYGSIKDSVINSTFTNNNTLDFKTTYQVPSEAAYTQSYWLKEKGTLGMYKVDDRMLIGKPENGAAIEVTYVYAIGDQEFTNKHPVIYKWNDPVDGEKYRPFVITPPVFVNIPESVYIFSDESSRQITVTVKAGARNVTGEVRLNLPDGWKSEPTKHSYTLEDKNAEALFTFTVTPPAGQSEGQLKAIVTHDGKEYGKSINTVDYDHIKTQVLMPDAEAKIVKLNIKKYGETIGYIAGAGDVIPAALREIGYEVWEMKDEEVTAENLSSLDAVVLGIRALNTNERLPYFMQNLLNYVQEGGTLVIQYNTSHRLKTDDFAPYPLELSRDRVTDEFAEVRILAPEHPVMSEPNQITQTDFEGWVQERGLYFPNKWDDEYTAVLSSNDKGETPKEGGLLVAKYGNGHYVYTGYSWFRELPAGVPGAFRIFVNLVSLGNKPESKNN
ncbi:LmbE family protein [Fulvivirga sp. RKSG066]|uniref:PIG-L family deacetylase n=1 Tax=Fulvivirga aurantia TaxID=2529383 RepID=UPI0012BB6946|nr:PIG-L family deacetylase [Fulvivirga aurantia]MTI20284.1 LmbE family protein [Fulvivirga aurantia]